MAQKVNTNNVGYRAMLDRLGRLFSIAHNDEVAAGAVGNPPFGAPNGVATAKTTFDTLVTGHNELVDEVAAVREAVADIPFPYRASS